jgi:hypothetical protein
MGAWGVYTVQKGRFVVPQVPFCANQHGCALVPFVCVQPSRLFARLWGVSNSWVGWIWTCHPPPKMLARGQRVGGGGGGHRYRNQRKLTLYPPPKPGSRVLTICGKKMEVPKNYDGSLEYDQRKCDRFADKSVSRQDLINQCNAGNHPANAPKASDLKSTLIWKLVCNPWLE